MKYASYNLSIRRFLQLMPLCQLTQTGLISVSCNPPNFSILRRCAASKSNEFHSPPTKQVGSVANLLTRIAQPEDQLVRIQHVLTMYRRETLPGRQAARVLRITSKEHSSPIQLHTLPNLLRILVKASRKLT